MKVFLIMLYIKDFNRFMYNKTKHKEKRHFYMNCSHCFTSKDTLRNYREVCLEINGKQATKMHKKSIKAQFTNYDRQLRLPFVLYVDIDTDLKEVEKIIRNCPNGSNADKY